LGRDFLVFSYETTVVKFYKQIDQEHGNYNRKYSGNYFLDTNGVVFGLT